MCGKKSIEHKPSSERAKIKSFKHREKILNKNIQIYNYLN